MEKRFVVFIVVTVALFLAYTSFNARYAPPSPPENQEAVPLTTVSPEEAPPEPLLTFPEPEHQKILETETEKFIITFSLTGGYIKDVYSKEFKETLPFHSFGYIAGSSTSEFTVSREDNAFILTAADQTFKKRFGIEGYVISFDIVDSDRPQEAVLFYNTLEDNRLYQRYQEFFYRATSPPSAPLQRTGFQKAHLPAGPVDIAGVRGRYFCCVLFGQDYTLLAEKPSKEQLVIKAEASNGQVFHLYTGPQTLAGLTPPGLTDILSYGFFHPIAKVLIKALFLIHSLTRSWGVSIILLAAVIYFVLFPFTAKSTRSMKQMQLLQPKMKELQEKYKDNPQKLQKEMMEFYRSHKINPLGGCLPLFLQLPVFFSLYQVLLRLVELKGTSFLWIKDLSLPDQTLALPFSLTIPLMGKLEYLNVLPLIFIVLMFFQQKTMSVSTSKEQQKQMMFMPFLMGLIFYNFPSCLNLYWLVQNVFTVWYQYRASHGTAEA